MTSKPRSLLLRSRNGLRLWALVAAGTAGILTAFPATARADRVFVVSSLSALRSRINSALPGDRIFLTDGVRGSIFAISVTRSGTAAKPIVISALHVGGAEMRGGARFEFKNAAHVTIRGFRFTNPVRHKIPVGSHHIRFTRNTFELGPRVVHWLEVAGDDAEVDFNAFQNKSTIGVFVAVGGSPGDMAKRTRIHHNFFFNHTFDGGNGGEAIRLGDSTRTLRSARAIVEHNLFERANGDAEAISSKSGGNIIRYNTIRNSLGCIVLRQADRNQVYGNFVISSGCGIRIYGDDHRIYNNVIVKSASAAIRIGSGTVRDLQSPGTADYDAPDRVRIVFNTVVDNTKHVTGENLDDRPFPPSDCIIDNNIVVGNAGTLVNIMNAQGLSYEGNILWGSAADGSIPASGFLRVDPQLVRGAFGIYRLKAISPAIDAELGSHPEVMTDYDGQQRIGAKDVGADERSARAVINRPLRRTDVGPNVPVLAPAP